MTSFGAAGALLALLFWVYYSAQIFLFGAALTKARAEAAGRVRPLVNSSGARSTFAPSGSGKEPASVLSLAVFLLLRAIALMIVDRWERKEEVRKSARRQTTGKAA